MSNNKPSASMQAEFDALGTPDNEVRCQNELPQTWDFTASPLFVGTVIRFVYVEAMRRGEKVEVRTILAENGDKRYTIWEQPALTDFFDDIGEGQKFALIWTGKVDIGKGKTLNTYRAKIL